MVRMRPVGTGPLGEVERPRRRYASELTAQAPDYLKQPTRQPHPPVPGSLAVGCCLLGRSLLRYPGEELPVAFALVVGGQHQQSALRSSGPLLKPAQELGERLAHVVDRVLVHREQVAVQLQIEPLLIGRERAALAVVPQRHPVGGRQLLRALMQSLEKEHDPLARR
jgi:hypothetical protein